MTSNRKWMVAAGVLVALGLAAAFGFHREPQTQYITAKVQHGEIRDAVDATGTVSAVITVQVGSQVSGTVAKLYVDFNSRVHKGQIVAQIDSSLLEGALLQASADLENARANVQAAQANVEKANATVVQTKAEFDRTATLEQQHLETHQNLEIARANYEAAGASKHAAMANVEQAKAQVSQKEAALAVSRTNLDYTVIRSPIDGTVVARNVDVGQTVAASLQAPTIFTIAQDLTKMQVYANIDESDVGRIRLGQSVSFKVDAFPKETFTGTVSQIRMNATTIQNVVTYNAIVDFANPNLKLFPGMTAYVSIPVATVENATKLPNAALRFKPPMSPEELRAVYAKYGLNENDESGGATDAGNGQPQPQQAGQAARKEQRSETSIVWKLNADNTLEPLQVTLGITDHAFTEVTGTVKGSLRSGDELVTTAIVSRAASGPGAVRR